MYDKGIVDTFRYKCPTNASGGKGIIRRHCIHWMHIYFSRHCDIMPTTRRLHLSDNFTRHEVYQEYKDDMLLQGVPYV